MKRVEIALLKISEDLVWGDQMFKSGRLSEIEVVISFVIGHNPVI
jgi:hypothetical protein